MLESDFDSLLRIFTDTEVMAVFDHPPFTHEQMDISSS